MEDDIYSKLHIAVCDDEQAACEEIRALTVKLLSAEKVDCEIEIFTDAARLLETIESAAEFQLLLLDVMMPQLDGMQLAAALRRQGDTASIVFISSNREMATAGYKVNAARYLCKPLQEADLREALMFCYEEAVAKRELLLPTAKGQVKISVNDIFYAENWDRGIRLHTKDAVIESTMRISKLTAMLPDRQFVVCHQSILVNLAAVRAIEYCKLILCNGENIPVSKYRQREVKQHFAKFINR